MLIRKEGEWPSLDEVVKLLKEVTKRVIEVEQKLGTDVNLSEELVNYFVNKTGNKHNNN